MAKISPPTLTRQIREDSLTPENVVAIARAYGKSPVRALVDVNLISFTEVMEVGAAANLEQASDEDLVRIISDRIKDGRRHQKLNDPMSIEDSDGRN